MKDKSMLGRSGGQAAGHLVSVSAALRHDEMLAHCATKWRNFCLSRRKSRQIKGNQAPAREIFFGLVGGNTEGRAGDVQKFR